MNQRTPGDGEYVCQFQTAPQLTRTLEQGFRDFGCTKDFCVTPASAELVPPAPLLSPYSRVQALWHEDCATPAVVTPWCSLMVTNEQSPFQGGLF